MKKSWTEKMDKYLNYVTLHSQKKSEVWSIKLI